MNFIVIKKLSDTGIGVEINTHELYQMLDKNSYLTLEAIKRVRSQLDYELKVYGYDKTEKSTCTDIDENDDIIPVIAYHKSRDNLAIKRDDLIHILLNKKKTDPAIGFYELFNEILYILFDGINIIMDEDAYCEMLTTMLEFAIQKIIETKSTGEPDEKTKKNPVQA